MNGQTELGRLMQWLMQFCLFSAILRNFFLTFQAFGEQKTSKVPVQNLSKYKETRRRRSSELIAGPETENQE